MGKDYSLQRQQMIDNQILPRGIKNPRVLEAMTKVPRDVFVPEGEKINSYYDGPLPIGFGQTISQPFIVAYMTELLELSGGERILEIGTGSGYQTAILAEMVQHVYTIEVVEELIKHAETILVKKLNYPNITFKCGNGRKGWEEHAPFDRMIVTAAPGKFPKELFAQLEENGIAVAPVGSYFQRMYRYRKSKDRIDEEALIGVSFVPFV